MATLILFSPANVRQVLSRLPSIAPLLPDPADEGVDSDAFPGVLRKTSRELYRWIANTHYEHLADAVLHLERVHAAGCRFDPLLTTTDRQLFVSHTTEVLVADDLLRRGYTVSTVARSNQPTPDLHVLSDGLDVAIEVYTPRELVAVETWAKDVTDLLQYVDVRASYESRVDTRLEHMIPCPPAQADPWEVAEMFAQTRKDVIATIARDVENSLRDLRPLSKAYPHARTPLVTTVEIEDVRRAPVGGPRRHGSFSYPGFGGYSPAGVFATTVKRALRKARKRQAQGVTADARVLVVSLMQTQIAEDLSHPAHLADAENKLEGIEPGEYGLDAITFIVRALPRGLAALLTLVDDAALTVTQVQAMFGQSPSD